jgi:hypothetical protein
VIVASFFIEMPPFEMPWSLLAVVTLFFLPAYALVAALMTAIGGAVTDQRQGQQIAGIVNLLFTFPFFFIMLIMAKPNSPVVAFLTLFPTTFSSPSPCAGDEHRPNVAVDRQLDSGRGRGPGEHLAGRPHLPPGDVELRATVEPETHPGVAA